MNRLVPLEPKVEFGWIFCPVPLRPFDSISDTFRFRGLIQSRQQVSKWTDTHRLLFISDRLLPAHSGGSRQFLQTKILPFDSDRFSYWNSRVTTLNGRSQKPKDDVYAVDFLFFLLFHPSVPQRRQQQPAAFQHKRATRKMCPIYSARCCKWNAQAKIFGFGKIC